MLLMMEMMAEMPVMIGSIGMAVSFVRDEFDVVWTPAIMQTSCQLREEGESAGKRGFSSLNLLRTSRQDAFLDTQLNIGIQICTCHKYKKPRH